jgi:hypothetical protein
MHHRAGKNVPGKRNDGAYSAGRILVELSCVEQVSIKPVSFLTLGLNKKCSSIFSKRPYSAMSTSSGPYHLKYKSYSLFTFVQ